MCIKHKCISIGCGLGESGTAFTSSVFHPFCCLYFLARGPSHKRVCSNVMCECVCTCVCMCLLHSDGHCFFSKGTSKIWMNSWKLNKRLLILKIILKLNISIGKEQWIFLVTEMFLPTQKSEGCLALHTCSDLCIWMSCLLSASYPG